MSSKLGPETPEDILHLTTEGDYKWSLKYKTGDYPVGAQLYYLIGEAKTRYDFSIAGDTAVIKIESEVVATIPDRAPFWLKYTLPGDPEDDDTVLLLGHVRKKEPRP